MRKSKIIYGLGLMFLTACLLKYLFVPSVFPPVYFTLEIVSMLAVLGLVFYVKSRFIHRTECRSGQWQAELVKLQAENQKMHTRIEELEKKESDFRTFSTVKEEMISALMAQVNAGPHHMARSALSLIRKHFELVAGIVYFRPGTSGGYEAINTFGLDEENRLSDIDWGEGMHGQALADGRAKEIDEVPADYLEISSGSGSARPAFIYFLPLSGKADQQTLIEIASFKKLGLDIIWNEFLETLNGQINN